MLNQLKVPRGATKTRKRVGRGQASGQGKTAGRGGKGQKARSGNMRFEGFEGGQSPLQRRLPKFGFTNPDRRLFEEVQIEQLAKIPQDKASAGIIDAAFLAELGLIKKRKRNEAGVVVLGKGTLKVPLKLRVDRVTAGARAAIEEAGGSIEVIPAPQTDFQKRKAESRAGAAARS